MDTFQDFKNFMERDVSKSNKIISIKDNCFLVILGDKSEANICDSDKNGIKLMIQEDICFVFQIESGITDYSNIGFYYLTDKLDELRKSAGDYIVESLNSYKIPDSQETC